MLQQHLESAWGILVPAAAVIALVFANLSFEQWKLLAILALLITVAMLYHKRLRHFILLPSGVALASGLALMWMNSAMMR